MNLKYISLLKSGSSGATNIAKKSGLHRANVYETLGRLSKKSLISKILVNGSTRFEAAPPQTLTTVLDEKKSRLNAIMPQLQLHKDFSQQNSTQIIEGVNGFMSLLHGLLSHRSDIMIIGSLPRSVAFTRMVHFEKECVQKGIKLIRLMNDSPSTVISGDTVLITLWEKEITSIAIKNKSLADSYRLFFSTMKNEKTAS